MRRWHACVPWCTRLLDLCTQGSFYAEGLNVDHVVHVGDAREEALEGEVRVEEGSEDGHKADDVEEQQLRGEVRQHLALASHQTGGWRRWSREAREGKEGIQHELMETSLA